MKKTYIKPEMQVVKMLHTNRLLAGSMVEEETINAYEEEYSEDGDFHDLQPTRRNNNY